MIDKLNELIGKKIKILGEEEIVLFNGKLDAFEYGEENKVIVIVSNKTEKTIQEDDIKEIMEI